MKIHLKGKNQPTEKEEIRASKMKLSANKIQAPAHMSHIMRKPVHAICEQQRRR